MSIRSGRKARAFALQRSDKPDAGLTGPTATDVLREEPTASGSVVADLDLLQTVIERIFSAGMHLNSPRDEAASSAARIATAIAELDDALLAITDAGMTSRDHDRPFPRFYERAVAGPQSPIHLTPVNR